MLLRILMVENDQDDRLLTEKTFQMEKQAARIKYIFGVDLPAFLQKNEYKPQLILLSMVAQPYSGIEMIRQIRATEGYNSVPIVILSESMLPDEVHAAYAAGAHSFIKKPATYGDTLFKIRSFINYWFHTVEFPSLAAGWL